MAFLAFLAAISWLAGLLGGLTGTGGIIMPPLMIEIYGVEPHLAMGMAQASYILPSTLATFMFIRKGQFDWRVALPMALSGLVCSFLAAAYLKPLLDAALLSVLFALCVMLSGAVMLWKGNMTLPRPLAPPWRAPMLVVTGAAVGAMAGVTGSGGNAILVPLMVFFGLDVLSVLGACQFFAVLTSGAGTLGNSLNMSFNLVQMACLIAAQLVGISIGVSLAQRMNTAGLKRCVGVVCLLAGMLMLAKALSWL